VGYAGFFGVFVGGVLSLIISGVVLCTRRRKPLQDYSAEPSAAPPAFGSFAQQSTAGDAAPVDQQ
jgi:hypothetical protein